MDADDALLESLWEDATWEYGQPPLPHDILELVAVTWEGRKLGLTCHHYFRLLDPMSHVIEDMVTVEGHSVCRSRLPDSTYGADDGIFHGVSEVYTTAGKLKERIEYNLGEIVYSDLIKNGNISRRDILACGHLITWLAFDQCILIDDKAPERGIHNITNRCDNSALAGTVSAKDFHYIVELWAEYHHCNLCDSHTELPSARPCVESVLPHIGTM